MAFISFIALIILRLNSVYSDPTSYEEIDHTQVLLNDISDLYLNEKFSDIVFVVDNERFHAHRIVLASRSDYFSALLYGGLKESREMEVPINEASATSFKVLLEYVYSGRINLRVLQDQVIFELFILSNSFGFSNLQYSLSEFLRSNFSVHNVCSLFEAARLYQDKQLEFESLNFIDNHALGVLQSKHFLSLSPETIQLILNRDKVYANELDIFRAVCRWIKKNQHDLDGDVKTKVLSAVRYQFMDVEELSEVRRSPKVCSDTILNVIKSRKVSLARENARGRLEPNVNFALTYQGTLKVTTQIDGSTTIMLDYPSNINYIETMLQGGGTYSYYIEVSMDRNDWLRVIDHSNYDCRSIQRLWIHRRVVRYIRIVGSANTSNKTFSFLDVMYKTDKMNLVEIKNGLVAPKYNVALTAMNATVIKGESNIVANSLVNGNYEYYTRAIGYTYHSLESEGIVVQLAQPYVLSSMRLLLWDLDSRSFGYIIEVSVNKLNWQTIVDKSNESAWSWQLLQFEARPIVYIRITGIHSTINSGYFYCVHLETPAQVPLDSKEKLLPKRWRSKLRHFGSKMLSSRCRMPPFI